MIYVIIGPTGSGKTEVAIRLADILKAPIINGDAFQIYQEMNIGTAKISSDDPNYKKHYLLDICSPEKTYSVKDYQDDFRKTLSLLNKTYNNIIVCGGTGLYIKAALYDYVFNEEIPFDMCQFSSKNDEELYKELLSLDKESALKIHPHNRKRVLRALSIALTQDKNKSEIEAEQKHHLIYDDVVFLMIDTPRDILYENINKRVDKMFANGLIKEVEYLFNKYNLSLTAKAAIGYKEVITYLDKQISLEECIELIKKRSRNYAKRQFTFFNHQFDAIHYQDKEALIKDVSEGKYEKHL